MLNTMSLGDKEGKDRNFKMPTRSEGDIDDLFCCCFRQIYNALENLFCNNLTHVVNIRLFSQNCSCLSGGSETFYLSERCC